MLLKVNTLQCNYIASDLKGTMSKTSCEIYTYCNNFGAFVRICPLWKHQGCRSYLKLVVFDLAGVWLEPHVVTLLVVPSVRISRWRWHPGDLQPSHFCLQNACRSSCKVFVIFWPILTKNRICILENILCNKLNEELFTCSRHAKRQTDETKLVGRIFTAWCC